MPVSDPDRKQVRSASFDHLFERVLDLHAGDPEAIPVITGPTASGKSNMAMKLALALGGEIVSVDAMQVYRGFDIGTAKPTREEQLAVPHHMIDCLDACEAVSVAVFTEQVSDLLEDLVGQNKKPILCGGSVQYISALLDGLIFTGADPDPELREKIAARVDREGLDASWVRMRELDPQAASSISPLDRRRIIRFFELVEQTGKTKSALNRASRRAGPRFRYLPFWLDWTPRQALYQAIDHRVDTMYRTGLTKEVADLMTAYPDFEQCPAFRGIGYRQTVAFLQGQISESEAREEVARATRRYAKRQQTWLRRRKDLYLLLLDRQIAE